MEIMQYIYLKIMFITLSLEDFSMRKFNVFLLEIINPIYISIRKLEKTIKLYLEVINNENILIVKEKFKE